MEIIGKGDYELGAVWVARKVPAGHVTSHANQARIRTFKLNDPENTLYAPDVVSFAKKIGLYPADQPDELFSFSDIYDPITFSGARYCEARVWSFFSSIMGQEWSDQYVDYALGYNLTNRMPLFVAPPEGQKVSLLDTMQYMRSHYENTQLDMSGKTFNDVGAYTNSIYRAHPLTWSSTVTPMGQQGSTPLSYLNERPIATPQTGWNFVAQSRASVPRELAGVIWFGVDDSGTTVRTPVYGSATSVPPTFYGKGPQDGVVPPMMKFSLDSAFYVFNLVANWAYTRWDLMQPEISATINQLENSLLNMVQETDKQAISVYNANGAAAAVQFVTDFSVQTGEGLVKRWFEYFGELFVKYRDGYVITTNAADTACGCNAQSAGYPQQWYDRIVKDAGKHYAVPPEDSKLKNSKFNPVAKTGLKALR